VTVFWVAAALLCALAVGFLAWPLWRHKQREGRWSVVGLVVVIAIAPVAAALYFQVTTWDPQFAARVSEETRLVEGLAAHLEQNPNDLEGWRLLANSYMQLGEYARGLRAFEQLWARTSAPDDGLKIAYAEAQILNDRSSLVGDAGRLVEEVLAAHPSDPKALWYGGLVALETGRDDTVRSRWTALLTLDPPEQVANVVRTQLAALGGAVAAGAGGGAAPAAVAGPLIRLNVTLGEGRSVADLGRTAQLFILARAPEGGPPIAVIRQPVTAVPGEFTLSDANSMIAGRSLANYAEITVVARLSASGQPTEQSGDWFAQAVVRPADDDIVQLTIDQVVP